MEKMLEPSITKFLGSDTEAATISVPTNGVHTAGLASDCRASTTVAEKANKFNPLRVSSKYGICGLPLVGDTYRGGPCFGCMYCAANCRTIMPSPNRLQVADVAAAERELHRIIVDGNAKPDNIRDAMIYLGLPIHLGSMGDPLQPAEEIYHRTREFLAICQDYDRHVLISTKADTFHGIKADPSIAAIQLSVSNSRDHFIEPCVPAIANRIRFFHDLKNSGFRVGIRIQPFIPGISGLDIVEAFPGADHYVVEGLKLTPQNKDYVEFMLSMLGLSRSDLTCRGLLCLRPELRLKVYHPIVEYFKDNGVSFSIADNDLRQIGNNDCCCGDTLIPMATTINTTALIRKYGIDYSKDQLLDEVRASGLGHCRAASLSASNRQHFGTTVEEILAAKYDVQQSPSSPKFFYRG